MKGLVTSQIAVLAMLLTTLIFLAVSSNIDTRSVENLFAMIVGAVVGTTSSAVGHKVGTNGKLPDSTEQSDDKL